MSALILKLIDEAILPAVLVFSAKVASLILLARFLKLDWYLKDNALVFSRLPDFVLANDLSNLFVLLVIFLGTAVVLIRLYHFHESHITPGFLARLLESDWEILVSSSFDLFHQALVWLTLAALFVLALLTQFFVGVGSFGLFFLGLALLIFLVVTTLLDLEREIKIARPHPCLFL